MPSKSPLYYKWESRKKQPPGESLPLLPGFKNEKDFAAKHKIEKGSHRKYLNARSQYAGYESFAAWEKSRGEAGVKKPVNSRKKKPTEVLQTGNLYVFDFQRESKDGKLTIPKARQFRLFEEMRRLILSLPKEKYIQFHTLANHYSKANESDNIQEWIWVSSILFHVGNFIEHDFPIFGGNLLQFFYLRGVKPYTFPNKDDDDFPQEYSNRMSEKTILGFKEIHVTAWDKPFKNHR